VGGGVALRILGAVPHPLTVTAIPRDFEVEALQAR